MLSILVLLICF